MRTDADSAFPQIHNSGLHPTVDQFFEPLVAHGELLNTVIERICTHSAGGHPSAGSASLLEHLNLMSVVGNCAGGNQSGQFRSDDGNADR